MAAPAYILKRLGDYSIAAAALVVLAPALAAIAAAIKLDSRGSVFFTQDRLGYRGRPFRLIKFRTMKDAPIRYNPDGSTRVDDHDDRVTRVGRYLRGAIDELPQLINVLRGEMSLVGPRPDMASQRALYADGEDRKLDALPGITSLAVVHGRNDLPWKQRIEIDITYIENWSLELDLKIVISTLLMAVGKRPLEFGELVASYGL